ncbi:HPr family phosphocarrier protein, partial [Alistipes putredinis]
ARPAGMLVKLAKELSSAVTITKGDRTVEATKLLAIMSLGVKKGEEITVSADSEEDLEKLKKFFEENL